MHMLCQVYYLTQHLQHTKIMMCILLDKASLPDMRSTTTTVTLSRLPRSTAALVSTVAAMRAADWRVAPLWRARRRQRLARLQASWLVNTSHRPSLASSSSSSSGLRASMVICKRQGADADLVSMLTGPSHETWQSYQTEFVAVHALGVLTATLHYETQNCSGWGQQAVKGQ